VAPAVEVVSVPVAAPVAEAEPAAQPVAVGEAQG